MMTSMFLLMASWATGGVRLDEREENDVRMGADEVSPLEIRTRWSEESFGLRTSSLSVSILQKKGSEEVLSKD